MLTVQNVRSKRGCIKRYNVIIRQCLSDGKGGLKFGMDMPTLNVLWPERYQEIKELQKLYKTLPDQSIFDTLGCPTMASNRAKHTLPLTDTRLKENEAMAKAQRWYTVDETAHLPITVYNVPFPKDATFCSIVRKEDLEYYRRNFDISLCWTE